MVFGSQVQMTDRADGNGGMEIKMSQQKVDRYKQEKAHRKERLENLFQQKIPAVVVTRGQEFFPEMIGAAKKNNVPLLRTQETTSAIMSGIISLLSVELAPRITRHGVLVEVYGEGVLLLGESGVGKSETAIELV